MPMSLSKGMASRVIFPRFLMMMQLSISAILSVTIIARREDRLLAGFSRTPRTGATYPFCG